MITLILKQIYYDSVGKHGAIGLMSLLFVVQFMMGLSIVSSLHRKNF